MAETADLASTQAQLAALRAGGIADRDPVRFAYLEALARRAAGQPAAIRQLLNAKVGTAADELASRPPPAPPEMTGAGTPSPLAELLAYIGQHANAPSGNMQPAHETAAVDRKIRPKTRTAATDRRPTGPELKSVAYFRDEWSKLSAEQQLTQTLAQAPENAGPMNSQHLVLRSLQRMRDIAPDYLQGFMSYIDTLIWLDHRDPTKPATGRSAAGESDKKPRAAKRGATKR